MGFRAWKKKTKKLSPILSTRKVKDTSHLCNFLACFLPLLQWLCKISTGNYLFLDKLFTIQSRVLTILKKKTFENVGKRKKMLVTSIFSFFNNVFYPITDRNQHLNYICICPLQMLSVSSSPIFVVWWSYHDFIILEKNYYLYFLAYDLENARQKQNVDRHISNSYS